MRNKYIYRSRISEHKFRLILRFFSYDNETKTTNQITGISRPAINKIFDKIRERIAKECEFRYNNRNKNLYICLMKIIKNNPLKLC